MKTTAAYEIREMRPEDAPAVKALEIEAGLSPWPVADYAAEAVRGDSAAHVAERRGKVIGFIIARLITIRNHPTRSDASMKSLEIYNLAVSRVARREGIGESLFRVAVAAGRRTGSVDSAELEVRRANTGAIRFYEQLGFRRTGLRRSFYVNPADDAVQMTADLMNA